MNRKALKNILRSFGCLLLYLNSGYLKIILANLFNIKKASNFNNIVLTTISSLIIACIIVLAYKEELIKEFKIYKKNFSDSFDIGLKYWFIGLFGMMVSNILIGIFLKAGQSNNEKLVQEMISSFPLLMILNAGILAPINEEILFRKCFRNVIKNNYVFVIISGLIFGYLHVIGAKTLAQNLFIIPYSMLGISFGIMYVKTKSVFTSMTMHMIHNTALTLVSILI